MLGPPPGGLVGRSAELADVDAFLRSSEQGFNALIVEGEDGIGKTALLAESVRLARSRGAYVMLARATGSEAGLSLGGLGDLFDSVGEPAFDLLPAPQSRALRGALLRAAFDERGIDERALYAGVLSMLRIIASNGPVLVAVDDAQWLDASTARALGFATRRLERERIGILVTVRVWERAVATFVEAADAERRRTLRLGPLSAAALHEVIKNRTGASVSRPVAVQVARSFAGNPLYALEIAGTLSDRRSHNHLSAPPSLGELLAARLARLPEPTRRALAVAAAASQPTTALVEADALLPAVRDGIVSLEHDRIVFAHPLFASAVYSLLDEAGRHDVHRVLASLVEEPEESARHGALAGEGPDRPTAARLDAAAAIADRRGAPGAAVELVELALDSTPDDDRDERLRRTLVAARYWLAAGDLGRTHELLDTALSGSPPRRVRAQALQLLAQLLGRRSSFADAAVAAGEALAAADDPELRAAIELDLAFCHASLGDLSGAEQHARAALGSASAAAQPGVFAEALGVVTMAVFLRGGGLDEDALATAVSLEDRQRRSPMQMRPTYLQGHLALWTGRLDEALTILERIHDEALERGEESPLPLLDFYRVWGWIWRGDLVRAGELAAERASSPRSSATTRPREARSSARRSSTRTRACSQRPAVRRWRPSSGSSSCAGRPLFPGGSGRSAWPASRAATRRRSTPHSDLPPTACSTWARSTRRSASSCPTRSRPSSSSESSSAPRCC